ncbi:glycosyltransferase family 2 protein [Marinobacter pelagius]|uniref:glycosyltransferase family 2 protein n=1 Tax=Marinobacter sp. C7 TaxID=2951363 RepID=UPI001EF00CCD|nr:glycosyltransferase family 2 protein [Marinobacter sp. C7]MCG7199123.1 glycosyltransferase family 2 protein [Marinobacter sp. C7]
MTSALPPVTIGIPFYNAEATLLDAVRSVFAQTHQDWELILMDDGSTDRSLELAHSIKDPRIKVYSDGQNKRLAARLNEMPGLATHDYLARMDADDLMSPVRIERQLSLLVRQPELDLVSTGICSLTDANEPVGVRGVAETQILHPRSVLLGSSGIVHASLLGKRDWFSRNHYREDIRTGQDSNLWVRAFSLGDLNLAFLPDALYYYREDGNVVLPKLVAGYKECLRTILRDSGPGYSVLDKTYAFGLTLAKFLFIRVLSATGSLDLLRNRRNRNALPQDEKDKLKQEIRSIHSVELPLAD